MNPNSNEEDDDEPEEDNGMHKYGETTGLSVAEVDGSAVARHLTQQPRRKQHEQHHCYQHRSPIRHFRFSMLFQTYYQENTIGAGPTMLIKMPC